MENATVVLAQATEVAAVNNADDIGHHGRTVLESRSPTPPSSPASSRSGLVEPSSPPESSHGDMQRELQLRDLADSDDEDLVYHEQEVVDANSDRDPSAMAMLSPPLKRQRGDNSAPQHLTSREDGTATDSDDESSMPATSKSAHHPHNHSPMNSPYHQQHQGQAINARLGEEGAMGAISVGLLAQIKALIEVHGLSREQFMSIYDEYVSERDEQRQRRAQLSMSIRAHAQAQAAQAAAMLNSNSSSVLAHHHHSNRGRAAGMIVNSDLPNVNHHYSSSSSSPPPPLPDHHQDDEMEDGLSSSSHMDVMQDLSSNTAAAAQMDETDATGDSETGGDENSSVTTPVAIMVDGSGSEDNMVNSSHVGKMQSLVRTALESYETASPVMSEIGQKRKHFTLEEELRLQPSPFAQQLLERDQTLVAQAIKRYMNQYSIPQREVVEKTGLNQSHLSQHFLHGVTMKRAKRIKLYHWFEEDQKARTGKLQSADGSLNAVLESPKVEGSRRRPRWKWSPISTQILTEAFKKNQFPTREQRLELSRVCNDAELAMNNGAMIRGPEGDTEGITEQRINTWFTNRRKGLTTPVTPSPTKALTPGGAGLPFTTFHPTLLRAGPATTPVLTPTGLRTTTSSNGIPKFTSLTTTPLSLSSAGCNTGEDGGKPSSVALIPNTVQTLVSQIQQAQVHHHHHHHQQQHQQSISSGVTVAAAPSAQVMSSSPSSHLQNSPHLALPLAIALPGVSAGVLSSSSPHTLTTAPTPMQTVTVSPTVNPNAIHALLSQLHGPSAITAPIQLTAAAAAVSNNNSNLVQPTNIITLPASAPGTASASPIQLHNPPPPLTSSTTSGSTSSSPFQPVTAAAAVNTSTNTKTIVEGSSGGNSGGNSNGRGGGGGAGKGILDHHHMQQATSVTTLSQAQLQALMSQVQGAKVIDGTSPLAQFQLLTLPAGISLAAPPPSGGPMVNNEPPSVLWASNGPQGVPQTS